jgi:hypothetical protein
MQFNRKLLIPTLATIVGLLVGGLIAHLYWTKQSSEFFELQHRLAVVQRIRLLHQLRTNKNSEAIVEQETQLDGDIVGLGFLIEHQKNRDSSSMRALSLAAKHRKEFPSVIANQETDQALGHALSLATP